MNHDTMAERKKLDSLRDRYINAESALTQFEADLRARYAHSPQWKEWITRGERTRLKKLRDRLDERSEALFTKLDEISPRDWRSGVPAHWACTELTWEDIVRPLDQPLSVVPPMAAYATEPKR